MTFCFRIELVRIETRNDGDVKTRKTNVENKSLLIAVNNFHSQHVPLFLTSLFPARFIRQSIALTFYLSMTLKVVDLSNIGAFNFPLKFDVI